MPKLRDNLKISEEKDRVVAWLWLLDREEEGDFHLREVWKSLEIRSSEKDHPRSLHRKVPLRRHDVKELLNLSRKDFEKSLYQKLGITSLEPMIGLPKGPYYDSISTDEIKSDLTNALETHSNTKGFPFEKLGTDASNASLVLNSLNLSLTERVKNEFPTNPDVFFTLSPPDFSKLVMELLIDMGAEVQVAKRNDDHSTDLFAYFALHGSQRILTVVNCRQWRKNHKIGQDQVKQLCFDREQYRANKAMLVTAAHFSLEARYWEEQYTYLIDLRDYDALCEWLNHYGSWSRIHQGNIWTPKEDFSFTNSPTADSTSSRKQMSSSVESKINPGLIHPKVFISYTHEDKIHTDWVCKFATDLRTSGVDIVLDKWDLPKGADLTMFMEKGIRESKRVLLVFTPKYQERANERIGGVGYESMVVTGELAKKLDTTKFIGILRRGDWKEAVPAFMETRNHMDFRNDQKYGLLFKELLNALHNIPVAKPPIGSNPFY